MNSEANLQFARGSSVFEDLGISGFIRRMRQHAWLILVFPIVMLASSHLIFTYVAPEYEASMEVTPVSLISARSGAGIANIGGAGGLLGSVLGANGATDPVFSAYLESWRSNWFAARIAQDPMMMHRLFADQWTGTEWRRPEGTAYDIRNFIKRVLGVPDRPWQPPSADDVLRFLQTQVTVENLRVNVIAKVSIQAKDRQAASALLSAGHRIITDYLGGVFRQRTQEHVDYLLKNLAKVQVTDLHDALVNALREEQKQLMLTSSDMEFAAQPLGMHADDTPVSPTTASVLVESFLISALFYMALVVLVSRFSLRRHSRAPLSVS